ncbi:MAG: hypothetical protein ACBZ72_12170 [Candidatus Bathyarchaeia archaeon]
MVTASRNLKILVFASFCSLLIWVVFLLPSNFEHLYNVLLGKPDIYNGNLGMFISSFAGLISRFCAVIFAMAVGFTVWGGGINLSQVQLERLVEAALFLEGTYFILLFPSGLWWLGLGWNFLGAAYLLEAAFAGSALLILSFKVRDYSKGTQMLKWIGIAGVAYIAALWFNSVFRWFDQIAVIGSEFLLRGATSWGFLVSLTAMSLAVVFAVPGAYFLAKNKGESVWWFGLSLVMIGVYYAVYVAYSFTSGNLDSAMQIDVWTLPFIGLGLAMLRTRIGDKIK